MNSLLTESIREADFAGQSITEHVIDALEELSEDLTLVGEQGQLNVAHEDFAHEVIRLSEVQALLNTVVETVKLLTKMSQIANDKSRATVELIRAEVKVKDGEVKLLRTSLTMVTNAVLDLLADRNVDDEVNPEWTHEDNLSEVVAILGDGWGA